MMSLLMWLSSSALYGTLSVDPRLLEQVLLGCGKGRGTHVQIYTPRVCKRPHMHVQCRSPGTELRGGPLGRRPKLSPVSLHPNCDGRYVVPPIRRPLLFPSLSSLYQVTIPGVLLRALKQGRTQFVITAFPGVSRSICQPHARVCPNNTVFFNRLVQIRQGPGVTRVVRRRQRSRWVACNPEAPMLASLLSPSWQAMRLMHLTGSARTCVSRKRFTACECPQLLCSDSCCRSSLRVPPSLHRYVGIGFFLKRLVLEFGNRLCAEAPALFPSPSDCFNCPALELYR